MPHQQHQPHQHDQQYGADAHTHAHLSGLVAQLRAAGCVFAEDEAALLYETARDGAELREMTARRVAGHPLEHVLGWAEFAGRRIAVEPGVFVPRRRTEFLVRCAAARVPDAEAVPVLVDLCCGTGAVGAALLTALGRRGELHASDLDPAAVRCARRNLAGQADAYVWEGDLFAALPARLRGRVDVLTANVPYVPTGDIPLLPTEARDHEPRHALDGGSDGLFLLRRVAADAAEWLAPGGTLLTETSAHQARPAAAILSAAALTVTTTTDPDLTATVLEARSAERR
jgi:release factor glutamine methyltransferase